MAGSGESGVFGRTPIESTVFGAKLVEERRRATVEQTSENLACGSAIVFATDATKGDAHVSVRSTPVADPDLCPPRLLGLRRSRRRQAFANREAEKRDLDRIEGALRIHVARNRDRNVGAHAMSRVVLAELRESEAANVRPIAGDEE